MNLEQKFQRLKEILLEMESIVIDFSGGVDSTFLLKDAKDTLRDRVIIPLKEWYN